MAEKVQAEPVSLSSTGKIFTGRKKNKGLVAFPQLLLLIQVMTQYMLQPKNLLHPNPPGTHYFRQEEVLPAKVMPVKLEKAPKNPSTSNPNTLYLPWVKTQEKAAASFPGAHWVSHDSIRTVG